METTTDIITCVWTHSPVGYDDRITTEQAENIIAALKEDDRFVAPDDMTAVNVQEIWNDLVDQFLRENMRSISIDNGAHWMDPYDVIALLENPDKARWCGTWESITAMMDDDTRDRVNAELAPCSNAAFLRRYLELAPCDLIVG